MAMGLAVLMALSTLGAPVAAQEVVADPRQPSTENPHMHVYGSNDLANCFMHFDGNDTSGSAPEGYGEKEWTGQNARIEVDYTCRMESFKQDMYNSENGTITLHLEFEIDAAECQDTDAQCKNLTLTFFKGGFEVAQEEFLSVATNGATNSVDWEIPINENMTRFNKSEEPQIQVEFSYPGYSDFICGLLGTCGGSFRMYYHTPGNASAEIEFPVVNQTMPGGGDEDSGGLIGGVTDSVPGFGLLAGVGSLAMAAVTASRSSRDD
tara:strand:- start:213 stop:1007 length:795 start_codon:yes stop_codon:yes gene_type:complete